MAEEVIQADIAVVALLGFAIWETRKAYVDSVPKLASLRDAKPDSDDHFRLAQQTLDGDITTGLVALVAAITASYLTHSLIPFVLIGATYLALCYYHHSVLNAPSPSPEGN